MTWQRHGCDKKDKMQVTTKRYGWAIGLVWVALLAGCDGASDPGASQNRGNVSVNANEGRLVGRGRMVVDGHTVEVQIGRVRIDGVDYGPANNDSEIYFRSNGSYHQLLVNGEQRGPTRK